MAASVEHKVTAGVAGAGAGGVVGEFVLWALENYAFHGQAPERVSSFVLFVTPAVLAFAGGWLAPHTKRVVDVVESEAADLGVSVSVAPDAVERIVELVEREIADRFPAPAAPASEEGADASVADSSPVWHTTFPKESLPS